VNYLMVQLMADVLRSGTGAAVRSSGFLLPAAGKTGTAHDGWFAGFTSELLCVVWVGYDDYRDLKLTGAQSALPVWVDFMKRAAHLRPYAAAQDFKSPEGVVHVRICSESGQLATEYCPEVRSDVFIAGTEPAVECPLHTLYNLPTEDRVMDPNFPTPPPVSPAASPPAIR
jgi:penicillin-binding protein 1B